MIAKREVWNYSPETRVWAGKYRNSHNLLHWHYDCELLYVERGSIDVFCERKKHSLVKGQALYVDSEQVHYMQAKEKNTVLIVIIFDCNIVKSFLGERRLASPVLEKSYPIPAFYARLRDLLLKKPPYYGTEAALLVARLLLDIFRNETVRDRAEEDRTEQSFRRLLEEINEKYEYYTFADAAQFMGMSDAYFSRFFHASAGVTFSQHLNFVRTAAAVDLLHSDDPPSVTEIASRCGFGTIRNFNRIFKELTGHSPTRLPKDYVLDEKFSYPSSETFNPTVYDCELIESGEDKDTE